MAQAAIPAPLSGGATSTASTRSKAPWRWAGGLGLTHIVVMLAAFSFEGVAVEHGTPAGRMLHLYGAVSDSRVELGSYVEAMAFLPLLAALVVLTRLLSRTETARTAAPVALGLGVAYVASTFAVGFPPLTAAVYAAHHGVDAGTLTTVNDVCNYGFLLQGALSMAFTLALGVAALAGRTLTTGRHPLAEHAQPDPPEHPDHAHRVVREATAARAGGCRRPSPGQPLSSAGGGRGPGTTWPPAPVPPPDRRGRCGDPAHCVPGDGPHPALVCEYPGDADSPFWLTPMAVCSA